MVPPKEREREGEREREKEREREGGGEWESDQNVPLPPPPSLRASRNGSEEIDPIFTVKAEATDLTQPHSLPLLPSYSRRSLRPRSISLFLRAKGRLRDFIGLRQRIHVSFGICPSEVGTVNGK